MANCIPKVIGADVELANFILGMESSTGTGHIASRLLLDAIPGIQANNKSKPGAYPPPHFPVAEWGRKYLVSNGASNGSSVYIDAHHLEMNTPECSSPAEYVAAWHAALRTANESRVLVNSHLRRGLSAEVMANTSDRKSHSFGSHLNISLTRPAWNSLFEGARLLWLASYHVSSVVLFGTGKTGAENGKPWVPFQFAERPDFFSQLTTLDTTIPNRGIVNQRDEPLAGCSSELARYHCIFHESNLQHVAGYLKAGVLALVLLMLEADEVDLGAAFMDPVTALPVINRDREFQATFATTERMRYSAIDVQTRFFDAATRFVADGRCEGFLPDAQQIIQLWGETLDLLRRKDLAALSRRLDWALKLLILAQISAKRPGRAWDSPEMQYADLQYANVDPNRGLYWAYQNAGMVERIVSEEHIQRLYSGPPATTRAYARAMLLQRWPAQIHEIKWDEMTFVVNGPAGTTPSLRCLSMHDPFGLTEEVCGSVFSASPSLEEALDLLDRCAQKTAVH